jgi:MoxR-like ATPase
MAKGSANFIEPRWWKQFCTAVDGGFPVMLSGSAGTGKTTAVAELARRRGKADELIVCQCHADLAIEEIRGTLTIRDGSTTFAPGFVTRAARDGHWFVLEEVNLARPAISAVLNNTLDETGIVSIPETGEVIRVRDGFHVFFCLNDCGYSGTQEINPALRDRCVVIQCDYMPEDQELRFLMNRIPEIGRGDALRMIRTANAIREARRAGSTDFDFSMRSLYQWAYDAYNNTLSLVESFDSVILPKVGDPLLYGPQHAALREIAQLFIGGKK